MAGHAPRAGLMRCRRLHPRLPSPCRCPTIATPHATRRTGHANADRESVRRVLPMRVPCRSSVMTSPSAISAIDDFAPCASTSSMLDPFAEPMPPRPARRAPPFRPVRKMRRMREPLHRPHDARAALQQVVELEGRRRSSTPATALRNALPACPLPDRSWDLRRRDRAIATRRGSDSRTPRGSARSCSCVGRHRDVRFPGFSSHWGVRNGG